MGYLDLETKPKPLTGKSDIAPGQVALSHLDAALFLELQLVKLHTHGGSDSRLLEAAATPQMVKGYRPREREEHGVVTWTGGASGAGSVNLTFGTKFNAVPDVFVIAQSGDADILVGTSVPTATGVTLYWRDADANTHTSLKLCWIAKGI